MMNKMKKKIKRILGKFRQFLHLLQRKKKNYKKLLAFKKYIKNGLYYFDGNELAKHEDYNLKNKNTNKYFVFSFFKIKKLSSGKFFQGTYKEVFCTESCVVSYCKNTDIYFMNKNNYLRYSCVFPYPYAKSFSFDDKKQMICSEYIKGITYCDINHLVIWARDVIKIMRKTDYIIKNNTAYFIQHGDAWFGNIIWTSEKSYVYIDLDRIGYWPALYDIIYGFTVALREKAFSIIETELYEDIYNLFISKGLCFSIDILDCYYSSFIKIWKKREPYIAERYIKPFYSLDERYKKVHILLKGDD